MFRGLHGFYIRLVSQSPPFYCHHNFGIQHHSTFNFRCERRREFYSYILSRAVPAGNSPANYISFTSSYSEKKIRNNFRKDIVIRYRSTNLFGNYIPHHLRHWFMAYTWLSRVCWIPPPEKYCQVTILVYAPQIHSTVSGFIQHHSNPWLLVGDWDFAATHWNTMELTARLSEACLSRTSYSLTGFLLQQLERLEVEVISYAASKADPRSTVSCATRLLHHSRPQPM